MSTFSFYANKHITTGEGGMILTNDKKYYEKCKSLRNLCFGINNNRFNHDDIGWNYRLTNIQAAIGCGQLKNISWIIKRKREIGIRYISRLRKNNRIFVQTIKNSYSKNIFWVFGVVLKPSCKIKRDYILKKLLKKGSVGFAESYINKNFSTNTSPNLNRSQIKLLDNSKLISIRLPFLSAAQSESVVAEVNRSFGPFNNDNTSVEKWLKEQPELFKYYKKYTYDEMKTALQDWLNPEDGGEEAGSSNDQSSKKDEGYTLNVKQKESFNEDEFDDLFKD